MSFAAVLIALVVGARALMASRTATLLLVSIFVTPVGVSLSMSLARDAPRTRVNFAFIGYRVPLAQIVTCGSPADVNANGGVWIGGGERRERDPSPDLIAIPGYRPHLLQVCSPGTPFQAETLTVRAVSPGNELDLTTPATGMHTQRVALAGLDHATTEGAWREGKCLLAGTTRISKETIENFAARTWREDLAKMPRSRARLLGSMRRAPADGPAVYCVDISSGNPARCAAELADPKRAVFLWRAGGNWVGVAPEGMQSCDCDTGAPVAGERTVTIPLHRLRAGEIITDDERRELPGFETRMISRAYAGGSADTGVPRDASAFAPAPYRLGKRRQVRIARTASDLLIFVDEPQVQLRSDDLFGREVEALGQGELDLIFGNSTGREVLVVDLAASPEDLLPKPVFREWITRISIERDFARYVERSTGSLPRGHRLGEIATFGTDGGRVRPLIVVERALPPHTTWILPLAAALLIAVVIMLLATRRYRFGAAWDVLALAFFLLTLRWMLSTRVKLDMPGAVDPHIDWIVSGTNLFILPPLVVAAAIVLTRYWRAFHDAKETRTLWRIVREGGTPRKDHEDRLAATAGWSIAGLAAAVAWILYACSTLGAVLDVGFALILPTVAALAATLLAVALYIAIMRIQRPAEEEATPAQTQGNQTEAAPAQAATPPPTLARFDEAPRWTKKQKQKGKKPFRLALRKPDVRRLPRWFITSWTGIALLAGVLFILVRVGAMALGSQEEIAGGMRTDVLFVPAAAAALAALSREPGRSEGSRLFGISLFGALAFAGVGMAVNDLGLIWLGGMAIIFCLPFVSQLPRWAAALAILYFFLAFLSPKLVPALFLKALEAREGTSTIGTSPNEITFRDELQVRRDRDHYRMLDTVQSDLVEKTPSQLAREVVLDRERVRYQATNGAWREGLRATGTAGSLWLGSGYLQSKPIVGNATFRDAARSDYVYPLYVRSEFGLIGLGAMVLVYAALFLIAPARRNKAGSATRLALWSLGIAAGTALFMIGGTSGLYPFSGKWPLLLSIGSNSDLALGLALLILGATETD
jgi:hypothetical protein